MSVDAQVKSADGVSFDAHAALLIIGAGACGLTAALAARDAAIETVLLERDASASGSTSLSSGMIPAAGTRAQSRAGITDSPALFAADIQAKAHGEAPPALVRTVAEHAGPAIDWLAQTHGVALDVVTGFLYPGHTVARMHAPPSRTGAELHAALSNAVTTAGADCITNATVTTLFAEHDRRIAGVEFVRPDGRVERIGCDQLILACNGYGGNREMVEQHIPEMADAQYFGHPGNQGEAVVWGQALGGVAACMSAYQGHGSVASPHQILITWALMMEGGIQVNTRGERFSNEHDGYSEQSVRVLAQPRQIAWCVFDERLHALGQEFDDYRGAMAQGALKRASSIEALATTLDVPVAALKHSIEQTDTGGLCQFGRDFSKTAALEAPFYAIRVTGALFHTQGGLMIDSHARVVDAHGQALPNLYAGGGAACGVSGKQVSGYLSGNGLLNAVALGRVAGRHAASCINNA